MRRVLIDRTRRQRAKNQGAGRGRLDMDDVDIPLPADDEELLAVGEALDRYATGDAQNAELVKLRYFWSMTIEGAAVVLSISAPTSKRWWAYAKAWLFAEVKATKR